MFYRIGSYLFFSFAMLRVLYIWIRYGHSPIDFHIFYEFTKITAQGVNPYDPQVLAYSTYLGTVIQIVAPPLIPFIIPFTLLDIDLASNLFFLINVVCSFLFFFIFWKKVISKEKIELIHPTQNTFNFSVGLTIFLSSSPVVKVLTLGQVPLLSEFCILLVFFSLNSWIKSKHWTNVLLLALSAAFKYSIPPIYMLVMVSKKKIGLVITSLFVFSVLWLFPIFLGQNILTFLGDYFYYVYEQAIRPGGFDSYLQAGHDMVNFDFFKNQTLNTVGKILLTIPFLYALYRDREKSLFSINLLFYSSCMTMILFYHRVHDLCIVIPLLIYYCYTATEKRNYILFSISFSFLLFFSIPFGWIMAFSNYLGNLIGENSVIYLSKFYIKTPLLFPVAGIVMFLLTIFSMFVFYLDKDTESTSG